jgi:hypothetical protein
MSPVLSMAAAPWCGRQRSDGGALAVDHHPSDEELAGHPVLVQLAIVGQEGFCAPGRVGADQQGASANRSN